MFYRLSALVLILTALASLGCGSNSGSISVAKYNSSNIQRLRNAYAVYSTHKGSAPKDEVSLKEFLKTDEAAAIKLERMGVDVENVDDIFVSERDNEPFMVRWNVNGPKDHAIVFESVGVGGKRMVAFFEPRELASDEWEQHWNGKVTPEF